MRITIGEEVSLLLYKRESKNPAFKRSDLLSV